MPLLLPTNEPGVVENQPTASSQWIGAIGGLISTGAGIYKDVAAERREKNALQREQIALAAQQAREREAARLAELQRGNGSSTMLAGLGGGAGLWIMGGLVVGLLFFGMRKS